MPTEAVSVLPSQLSVGHCSVRRNHRASFRPSQWETRRPHALPSLNRPPWPAARRGARCKPLLQLSLSNAPTLGSWAPETSRPSLLQKCPLCTGTKRGGRQRPKLRFFQGKKWCGVSLLHRVCTADNEFRLGNLGRLPGGGGTEEQQQREDVPGGRSSDERKHAGSPRRSGRLQAQGGSVLSQPKFRSRRLGVHGIPDTPWTLIFNPLSVYLLSREGRS